MNLIRQFIVALIFVSLCSDSFGQTPIFSMEGKGKLESRSFTISHPATLVVSLFNRTKKSEDTAYISIDLNQAAENEIDNVEGWSLDLGEKNIFRDEASFRVRVDTGKYFFEIDPIGEVDWKVVLTHDDQKDRYHYKQTGAGEFTIFFNEKKAAITFTEQMATSMVYLLNGASK